MPLVVVADISAKRREKQHGYLARKSKDPQQRCRAGQLIDQPQLRSGLHPGSDERNKLSGDEELEVAVLHRAEARRKVGAKARGQCGNVVPPLVRCDKSELVTMPSTR